MTRHAPIRRVGATLGWSLSAVLLASCASQPPPSPAPSTALASSTPSPVAERSVDASPSDALLTAPGRPYPAADVLEAMRTSRRPGGVPDELQTDGVAAAVADAIWTLDGTPWDAVGAGGSCGPTSCTLEIGGTRADAPGEDLWVFAVDPASGAVELTTADLHAVPDGLVARVDATARGLEPRLEDLLLTSVRWLPPPAVDRFVLAYRSGDEEESCAAEVELDAGAGALVAVRASGC